MENVIFIGIHDNENARFRPVPGALFRASNQMLCFLFSHAALTLWQDRIDDPRGHMKKKRAAITPEKARKWAEMAHVFFIDALSSGAPLALKQIAFQGGTNLHLSWGSPRFSEDLDFLLSKSFSAQMRSLVPRLERRMTSKMMAVDPSLKVQIIDKTREGEKMINFRIVVTSPEIVGQSMVKAEFWQVDEDYLSQYETRFAHPVAKGDIVSRLSQPLPAGTLESAFADKVVALSYRPRLKWRDIFDIWWISGQKRIDPLGMVDRIRHQALAYAPPEGASLASGLRDFLSLPPEDLMKQADPDLKRWLPKALWDAINPDGIEDMVSHVRDISRIIADEIETLPDLELIDPDVAVKNLKEEESDANPCL